MGSGFACDGNKPVAPVDCEGHQILSMKELKAYWKKYQLPAGLVYFDCSTGVPRVSQDPKSQAFWKKFERTDPTCRDERGRKKPCI